MLYCIYSAVLTFGLISVDFELPQPVLVLRCLMEIYRCGMYKTIYNQRTPKEKHRCWGLRISDNPSNSLKTLKLQYKTTSQSFNF